MAAKCFLCRELPVLKFQGREGQVVQNWTKGLAMSLLSILGLVGPEESQLEPILSQASFCVKCQETVCNGEFILKTIPKLQLELETIRNQLRALLLGNESTVSGDFIIQHVITTMKMEDQETIVTEEQEEEGEEGRDVNSPPLKKLQERQEHSKVTRSGRSVKLRHPLPHEEDGDGQDSSPEYKPSESGPDSDSDSEDGQGSSPEYELPDSDDEEEEQGEEVTRRPRRTRSRKNLHNVRLLGGNGNSDPRCSPVPEKEGKKLDILAVVAKLQAETRELLPISRAEADKNPPVQLEKKDDISICPECEESFTMLREYRKHLRNQHPTLYREKVANGEIPTQIRKPIHPGPPPVSRTETATCPNCTRVMKAFRIENHLLQFCKGAPRLSPYNCNICTFSSTKKRYLKKHLRIHSDERPFLCTQCPFTSKTFSGLWSHRIGVHEKKRRKRKELGFKQCTKCGKFIKGGECVMRFHMTTVHENRRPYACSTCGKTFNRKSVLDQHKPLHTDPHWRKKSGVKGSTSAGRTKKLANPSS